MRRYPKELAESRLRATVMMPYMTQQLMALQPIERPGLGTLMVDKWWRLYYDVEFLRSKTTDEAAVILLHEALHCYLRHCHRIPDAKSASEAKAANYAKDLATNSLLMQSGLKIPEGGLIPSMFPDCEAGWTAEEYYEKLSGKGEEQPEPPPQQAPPSNQDEAEEESNHPDDSPAPSKGDEDNQQDGGPGQSPGDEDAEQEGDEGQGYGDGDDDAQEDGQSDGSGGMPPEEEYTGTPPDSSQGEGGSSQDGQPKPWECPPPDEDGPEGMSSGEQEIIRRETAEEIEKDEKSRGNVPGGLAREAKRILHPKVDPVRELMACVRHAVASISGFGDYTYRRPSRRKMEGGPILPAHRQPAPQVVVCVDTSGSMGENDLALALGTIAKVLKGLPNPRGVRVLAGDTCVQAATTVFRPEQVETVGGGGTDMGAMILSACEERPEPTAILVVTDGYTPWPDKAVRPKVVAALTQTGFRSSVPPWIRTVVLNGEDQ